MQYHDHSHYINMVISHFVKSPLTENIVMHFLNEAHSHQHIVVAITFQQTKCSKDVAQKNMTHKPALRT